MFVDNWPALDVIVKGTSLQEDRRKLLLLLEDPDEDNFLLWVARVPSSCNVADHPSRGHLLSCHFSDHSLALIPNALCLALLWTTLWLKQTCARNVYDTVQGHAIPPVSSKRNETHK